MDKPINSYVLDVMESKLKDQIRQLFECETTTLPNVFRQVSEAVQEYCTYRTLTEKYTEGESDK